MSQHPQTLGKQSGENEYESSQNGSVKKVDDKEDVLHNPVLQRTLYCFGLALGIIVSLGGYGVLQERIMSVPYGETLFRASAFLVMCNRLAACLFAMGMAKWKGETLALGAPLWKYCVVSLGNVGATMCQYEALKWVSFPVQTLGKSFKMLPVMAWGILMSKKSYKMVDWLSAVGVTAGVVFFLMTGNISAKKAAAGSSMYGLFLMLGFLASDSFTSTFQEKLFADHKTTKYNQMLYVNACSSVVSLSGLVVTGKLLPALQFCSDHPTFPRDAISISTAAVTGQFFIVSMVKDFGALALAATMNVRQLTSILVSYAMYSHTITILQSFGLIMVFAALFGKNAFAVYEKIMKGAAPVAYNPVQSDLDAAKEEEGVQMIVKGKG